MGEGSTPYFLKKLCELTSIEHEEIWATKFWGRDNPYHKVRVYPLGLMATVLEKELKGKVFDLILIDNDKTDRVNPAQGAFGRSDIIVWHDTQNPIYGFNKVTVPGDYKMVVFNFSPAHTSVFVKSKELFDKLLYFSQLINQYKDCYNKLSEI